MSYPNYPTLPSGQLPDSRKFQDDTIDNTLTKEVDAGYTLTRPRSTRAARSSWRITYTMLPNADRVVLRDFFKQVNGGASIFAWQNPQDGVTYYVRFKGNLQSSYDGRGTSQFWNCSFTLEQA